MKHSRKPLFSIVLLFLVACAIYFVASGDSTSLGAASPAIKQKQAPVSPNVVQKVPVEVPEVEEKVVEKVVAEDDVGEFTDTPFMPKMVNETLKAQLGNSAWHLLHTVLARYPDKPTQKQKSTLKQYIHLFAQVYPCGDCARHFQKLLEKSPPQVSSRKTAAIWGCYIHNQVNERLGKPEYDCGTILEDYDCGCGSDEKLEDSTLDAESLKHLRDIKVDEKSDKTRGG